MTKNPKFNLFARSITLLAALTLAACEPVIDPDSGAAFGIHAVVEAAQPGEVAVLPDGLILGETAELHLDRDGRPLYIILPAAFDKSCLKSIQGVEDEYAGPVLAFALTEPCTRRFATFTAEHIGQRMAVMLNGELVTAPTIQSEIPSGTGYIESGFNNLAEAKAIARQFY